MTIAKISNLTETPLHTLTPEAKAEITAALRKLLAFVEQQWPAYTCPSCDYFSDGFCKKWDARPPKDAWKSGCDEWTDPIPF